MFATEVVKIFGRSCSTRLVRFLLAWPSDRSSSLQLVPDLALDDPLTHVHAQMIDGGRLRNCERMNESVY